MMKKFFKYLKWFIVSCIVYAFLWLLIDSFVTIHLYTPFVVKFVVALGLASLSSYEAVVDEEKKKQQC